MDLLYIKIMNFMFHLYGILIGSAIVITTAFYFAFQLIDRSYINNPLFSKRSFPSLHSLGSKVFGSRDNLTG